MSRRAHSLVLAAALASVILLLGCGSASSIVANYSPRWACPSPTPKPFGEAGPVKEVIRHTRSITEGGDWEETVYYQEWEQEYPEAGGPPFPSPTPYGIVGTTFVFGQRVELGRIHAVVNARATTIAPVGRDESARQLYLVDIAWSNPTSVDIPIDYSTQVYLRAVETEGGAIQTAEWGSTAEAVALAGSALPDSISAGESSVQVPILAPTGAPHIVELRIWADVDRLPALPTMTVLAGTPTPTAAPTLEPLDTPTPNDSLSVGQGTWLTVQWTNTQLASQLPPCGDPGVTTSWDYDDASTVHGRPVANAVPAPPGADRLVQIALNQVGKRYVFGAKGPEQFDCSGLATWSYAQIGISIPQGTAGQWPAMRPVDASQLRPGDLVFFSFGRLGDRVDHVGMLVGDLNGNGSWDMVHAASPELGVRIDYDIFGSAYYSAHLAGFRTAR